MPAPKAKKLGFLDRIRAALATKDQTAAQRVLDEAEAELGNEEELRDAEPPIGESHIHVHAEGGGGRDAYDAFEERLGNLERGHQEILDRLDAAFPPKPADDPNPAGDPAGDAGDPDKKIEGELQEEAPPGTTDRATLMKDSSYMAESFQQTVSFAEILVPGIQAPTFDAKTEPKKTLDSLCRFRRTALDLAYATPEGRAVIDEFNGGRKPAFDSMSCKDIRTLFNGAASIRKASNRASSQDRGVPDREVRRVGPMTPAELNKRNRDFWANKQA